VVEAEAWTSRGVLLARVTVSEVSRLSAADLQQACRKELGPDHTPQLIVMERAFRKAA
jgi:hypothetical protein